MERHRARRFNPLPVIYANFEKCKIFAVFSRRLPNPVFGKIFSDFSAKQNPRFKTGLQLFVIQKIQPKLRFELTQSPNCDFQKLNTENETDANKWNSFETRKSESKMQNLFAPMSD